ncbi:MAG: 16S rRNA (uracil(1498)-N(3))-methyltransferase [Clostridia bacterium]|nr:16S rRNA (uracil(1498)-N(3))-methyltransferase [Clostridia bacterium]
MRLFVAREDVSGDCVSFGAADARHMYLVLKMTPGEEVSVCDDDGNLYECRLTRIDKSSAEAEIISRREYSSEPSVGVTVYAALSKGERFDYLIQKCVECGAAHIVPFVSERCVARPEKRDYEKKRLRFARIAEEASKQSRRTRRVSVGEIVDFSQALALAAQSELPLLLYEGERGFSLKSALQGLGSGASVAVITGPEGGFSSGEAEAAAAAGVRSVSLGPRILRCETAPVAALCAIMYETGNFEISESGEL